MAGKDKAISQAASQALSKLSDEDIAKMMSGGLASGLTQKLAATINQSLGGQALSSLPLTDKRQMRRIRALKNLQLESTQLEAQFYIEVQRLEAKYLALNGSLYEKRRDVITGSHEPTDEEAHWSEDEDKEEDDKKTEGQANGETSSSGGATAKDDDTPSVGVEHFWLIALKNCEIFADIIKEEDEEVLKHLIDLKVVYADDTGMDFTLEFHFSENDWFTNTVLTKSYKVACEVNKQDPWAFEGAAITEGTGCSIDWKKGKNLTVKTIKKKAKHKGKGQQGRPVTKTVPAETFFNIFSLPVLDPKTGACKDGCCEDEEDLAQTLSDDYTRAEFIRDRLVPKAVLFYTGEALDEDGEDEDFEEDFDEDEEDLEDDYNPEKQVGEAKQECKNQ